MPVLVNTQLEGDNILRTFSSSVNRSYDVPFG